MSIVTQASMGEFFAERVQSALSEQSINLEEASQVYLVKLLEDFTHTQNLQVGQGEGESGTPALFRLYQRAMTARPREAAFAYRHMGDVALVVAGMFSPHVERSLVNVDIAYNSADGKWTVGAYGRNVTDERYDNARLNTTDYVLQILSNDPSEFGVRAIFNF